MSDELFEAIEQHDLNRLSSLLLHGIDANAVQRQQPGWRSLHAAIEELEHGGSIEALILLLRHGAAVDGWDTGHEATPLLMALFRGQPEAVRILLAAGAEPNVVGSEGDTPLRWSVEKDDQEMAALLLRCGADKTINHAGGPSGMTALEIAARRLNLPMIKMLLAAGADPAAVDADYRTAQQCLPPRETSDLQAWDEAMALLGH